MNNLDKILGKIDENTRCRIDELQKETEARVDAMKKETDRIIAEADKKALLQTEKEEAAIASRTAAAVAMKSREVILAEKARLLAEVYRRAEAEILALPAETYTELLAGLAANAVAERVNTVLFLRDEYKDEAFDGELEGGYTLLLSADDRKKYGDAVLASAVRQVAAVIKEPPVLRLAEEDAGIAGGVVVRYGDTETTCSISVILAGLRDELDPVIMKTLLP
ncbi:MAG: hypothetical protein E7631_11720 [Ruminococcaceae bacterium]|nr:hypothetical protein [Oscillospiraceae bacterium]